MPVNLAFLYHQLVLRVGRWTQQSIHHPQRMPPPPPLIFTNCILQTALPVRGAWRQCIHLIVLRAIELDDVNAMMPALQAYGNRRAYDTELEDDMWCLHFPSNSKSPAAPFYIGRNDSDTYPVHRLMVDQLGIGPDTVHWGVTSLPDISNAFLVSLTLFLLYSHMLCPKIYAWWMSVCPSYTQEEVASMLQLLRVNGLPSIKRVPVESSVGRSFVCVTA